MPAHISTLEKQTLFDTLSTMLKAGISIVEATESMIPESKGSVKTFLQMAVKDLTQGKKLSETLEVFSNSFDPSAISVVKAAEESGKLETVLADLAIHFKKESEFNEKVKSALLYPALVVIVFLGVMLVILTVVIPRIAQVFGRLQVELPLVTRVLIFLSNLLLQNTIPLLIVTALIVACITGLYIWKKKTIVAFLYRFPGLREFGKEVDLALFSRSLSLLLAAGIVITEAIELAQRSVIMPGVEAALSKVLNNIKNGKSLAESLQQSPTIFPALMRRVIEAGEKSGTLERSAQDAAEYFETKMERSVKAFTTLLEPALLILIAGLIGGMMLAILAPIYGLIGQLGNR